LNQIRLETVGRNTGLPHIVELRYIYFEGSFFVLAGRKKSDWVLNAVLSQNGVVRLGETLYDSRVRYATDEERAAVYDAFKRKYGMRLVEEWYGNSQACLRLTPKGPPVKRGGMGGEFGAKMDFKEWSVSKRAYYDEVAQAFDSASGEYDFTISHNFVNTWIRRRSIDVLSRHIKSTDLTLEIGCGTGAEAIGISRKVAKLVAVDVAPRMIELVSAKAHALNLRDRLVPLRLAASEIFKLKDTVGELHFDSAYSLNGALNCEPRLADFVSQLHELLKPGGVFVCSIRNTLCLAEAVTHAAFLQFNRMNPRKHQPIMVSVGGRDIPSTYYSAGTFARAFEPCFHTEEVIALPALVPPAYLNEHYLRIRSITSAVERLDVLLSSTFPLNRLGDQTLFVFRNQRPQS
jgi:SAM-dependent methyltransferase